MTTSERRGIYIHCFTTQTELCANCTHYYPHYLKEGFRLGSGHCAYPRMKLRYAYDTCQHFQNKYTGDAAGR